MSSYTDLFYCCGIDASSGGYFRPPRSPNQVARLALRHGRSLEKTGPALNLTSLKRNRRIGKRINPVANSQSRPLRGHIAGIDPACLYQTGWGLVLAAGAPRGLLEALAPLRRHRREQASVVQERFYREFHGPSGYRLGETGLDFLSRHGTGPGRADPKRVPYHLLLVGHPDEIPFSFQYQLDFQYSVGRVAFDCLEDYARYAQAVVETERREACTSNSAVFFCTEHPDDPASRQALRQLAAPLAACLEESGVEVERVFARQASKANLQRILGRGDPGTLLFTTTHGMGFPRGHRRQKLDQGALLCQEWPGPQLWPLSCPIPRELYFSGDDGADKLRLNGTICFFFGCFTAGTPQWESFARRENRQAQKTAPFPFVSRLAQRLLAGGRARAVVGHVDLAWTSSYSWVKNESQIHAFDEAFKALLRGEPVGHAMEAFSLKYGEIWASLATLLERNEADHRLAYLWTAANDARNYVLLGDPAVRLARSTGANIGTRTAGSPKTA